MTLKWFTRSCAVMIFYSTSISAITPVDVDVELQMLIDVSGSVNSTEYDLQLQGYANAFNNSVVQNAIINGTQGKIAVQLIMWSGSNSQEVMIDWSLVDSVSAAESLSTQIASIARPFAGMTAIGSAIEYSYTLFDENGFNGTSQVIDISGDGTNNAGSSPQDSSLLALNSGVDTINGIVITSDQNVIDQYYHQVIGGDSPFLLAPANFNDFQTAIENKIVAEIAGTTPTGAITIPEPSTSSLIFFTGAIFYFRKAFCRKGEAL